MDVVIAGIDGMYWPTVYAPAVQESDDAELVGYTDLGVAPDAVEANLGMTPSEFGAEFDVPDVGDLSAAIDQAEGIITCTRNTRMPDVASRALEENVHAFAAKPIGVDVDDLRTIQDSLSPSTVFSAGRSAHGYPPVRTLFSEIGPETTGDVHSLRAMHQHFRCREWTSGTWYTDPGEGNGCNFLGWYPLHFAVEVLGPITDVWGHAQRMPAWDSDEGREEWDTPDHFKATIRHENGQLSTLEAYCDMGDWGVGGIEAEVVGTDGVVRYQAPGDEVLVHTDDGIERLPFDGEQRRAEENSYDIDQWIAACRGDGDAVIDAEMALHVAAAGCAWNEAANAPDNHAEVELLP